MYKRQAIFYAEERLKKTFAKIGEYSKENLDISSFAAFTGMVAELSNNENDYKTFYHNTKQGRMRHDKVHNLFGYNMTDVYKRQVHTVVQGSFHVLAVNVGQQQVAQL